MHSPRFFPLVTFLLLLLLAVGCSSFSSNDNFLEVTIVFDNQTISINVPPGTSVSTAVLQAKINLSPLDRTEPPLNDVIVMPTTIHVIRVSEEFEVELTTIPFEKQTIRNENLPEGQTRLIQTGVNGTQQTTYRHLFENGIEVSKTISKVEMIQEARPEIIMVGVQNPFVPIPVSGTLVYSTGGNAWMIRDNTANRIPIVTSGDLDSRIFTLSPDGQWLLYTRTGAQDNEINRLWAVKLTGNEYSPIDLRVSNVIHFAAWVPGRPLTITYSTVEPRSTAPGWQANNDLQWVRYDESGMILETKEIISPNPGGIYGWWGTSFAWSPDGKYLAYARAEQAGIVDIASGELQTLIDFPVFQTGGDWAWVTGLGWSPDHKILYLCEHSPRPGYENDESSPLFNLVAIPIDPPASAIEIVQQTGMFVFPSPSPLSSSGSFSIAFLQAIFPEQSKTSRYNLMLMDQDGSNIEKVFPLPGTSGLEPQQVVWAPPTLSDLSLWLGMVYQGDIWLMDTTHSEIFQVTGDGNIVKLDWK